MRTLRLSLAAGTVIVLLVTGLSVSVVAQSEEMVAVGPVYATGTSVVVEGEPGTITEVGDLVQMRDGTLVTEDSMSDPRVSGIATTTWAYDGYGGPEVGTMWGSMRLENDGGAWVGPWVGVMFVTANGEAGTGSSGWLAGVEGYEGLTYFFDSEGVGDEMTVDGLIFRGDPPPLPLAE